MGDHGVRKYDYETGRFLSVDPLHELMPGQNPYHYAFNSPLNYCDPSGLAPQKEKHSEKLQSVMSDIYRMEREGYNYAQIENSRSAISRYGHGIFGDTDPNIDGFAEEFLDCYNRGLDRARRRASAGSVGSGPSSGKDGWGDNGATVSFKYVDTDGTIYPFYDIPKEDLPDILNTLYSDEFDILEEIANDPSIKQEYGMDVWIDIAGFIRTNGIAIRSAPGDANHYYSDPGKGGTFIATLHTHKTTDAGCPSAADVVATVTYGNDFPGFTAFTISNVMTSSIQCINSKGLGNMIDKDGLNEAIPAIWGNLEHKYGSELNHSQKAFWGLLTITTYLNHNGYLNKNIFITPDPKEYKGK